MQMKGEDPHMQREDLQVQEDNLDMQVEDFLRRIFMYKEVSENFLLFNTWRTHINNINFTRTQEQISYMSLSKWEAL